MSQYKDQGKLSAGPSLFRPGHNCWRINQLFQASLVVDCADFYRAIHEAISKARHSVFIIGWDIDSRIRLLRGQDEIKARAPSVAGDFLAWKAKQNPDVQIYLLRWDASIAFMQQRELLAKRVWELKTPPNVHVWLDNTIPAGGSHHQKIILIDDEVVFTGGMDIAPQRWDERAHRPHEPERTDADGSYGPYHDIQIVLHGPAVRDFAELARWRWKHAAGFEAVPVRGNAAIGDPDIIPEAWPEVVNVHFRNMRCAIARTIPWMGSHPERFEVRQMYLDLIGKAEKFLYMENQFFSCMEMAQAINRRLKECPDLHVLLVSSYNPQGLFECEGMWAARIEFKSIVLDGIDPGRIVMAYPVIFDENRNEYYKRIHAKITAVDDSYFDVGSSNISKRSMSLDTECDLVLAATEESHMRAIADRRNDLIAEHTGMAIEDIGRIIDERKPVRALLNSEGGSGRCLREIADEDFTYQNLSKFAGPIADPAHPLLPYVYSLNPGEPHPMHNPRKHRLLLAIILFLIVFAAVVLLGAYSQWVDPDRIGAFLEMSRGTAWAFPLVCIVYVIGGLVMFPVTVLSLITAAVFGPLWGPLYAMGGALLSAAVLFGIGHFAGLKGLRRLIGEKARKIDAKLQDKGIFGMVTVRLVPIAPYSLVNLVAGISSIRFTDYMIGTFLGLLPGLIAKGFVGDALVQAFVNPSKGTYAYVGAGLLFWIALAWGTQMVMNRIRKNRIPDQQQTAYGDPHTEL